MTHRHVLDRRRFLAGTGLYLAGVPLSLAADEASFADTETAVGGRVGILALDTGSGRECAHRADERFALCSTFKWMLAACVLERVERGQLTLDRLVEYGQGDLLDHAPATRENLPAGSMSVEALCRASVIVSDNTAANLLLNLTGGPAALTEFLRRHGDAVTRLDRLEPELNSNLPGDPRDTTTPRAMAQSMQALLLGDALSPGSRERLVGWLKETGTGLRRLRAGLPANWAAGDKTGTGLNGAANDVAIAWPPDASPLLIAAYLSGSSAPPEELDAAHAGIAREIVRRIY
jgi:beta-lactamase class A